MNTTLATYMKIAITVTVISTFLYGLLYNTMGDIANNVANMIP